MDQKLKTKIKALAVYQIIGGLLGLAITFYLLDIRNSFSLLLFFILLSIVGLYSHSILCGIILFKDFRKGLKHSKLNQSLQVISFTAFGYAFQYLSGVYVLLGLDLTESFMFNFNFGISSSWKININNSDPALMLNVNLVAILLVVFISKTQQKLRDFDLEQKLLFAADESLIVSPNASMSDQ